MRGPGDHTTVGVLTAGRPARRIVIVGDALLDRDIDGTADRLASDAPVPVVEERQTIVRPGGAGLAAVLTARDGHAVTLVTALGRDAAGAELLAALRLHGVRVVDLGHDGPTPENIRLLAAGRPLLRLDRGARRGVPGPVTDEARGALEEAEAILVADEGRGLAAQGALRELLSTVVARCPMVWDPHARGPAPIAGVALVTPSRSEAASFSQEQEHADDVTRAPRWCRTLLERWSARAVAVKLGARGAVVVESARQPLYLPAPYAAHGDVHGAAERFASRATEALAAGVAVGRAVEAAVEAAAVFVASGGASSTGRAAAPASGEEGTARRGSPADHEDAHATVARVRARGGTIVATGGTFDVLDAGQLHRLTAARALGDCLVVCLRADASVRRLEGDGRPLHAAEDRRALLLGLRAVDAVTIFDDDTPARVLAELAPDVWVEAADAASGPLVDAGAPSRENRAPE